MKTDMLDCSIPDVQTLQFKSDTLVAARACRLGLGGIVQIWCGGKGVFERVAELLRTSGGNRLKREGKEIVYGILTGPDGAVDEVLLAHTEQGAELNCHGGTTAARAAMSLLLENGFREISTEEWHWRSVAMGLTDAPACEALIALENARTPLQARLLCAGFGLADTIKKARSAVESEKYGEAEEIIDGLLAGYKLAQAILKVHRIAVVGAPNAGKSTLFNRILSRERSLVSELAGTTRDAVRAEAVLDGLEVELADTAGLLLDPDGPDREAVVRARREVEEADLILLVVDGSRKPSAEDREAIRICSEAKAGVLVALSKSDLPQVESDTESISELSALKVMSVSAVTGQGIRELCSAIAGAIFAASGLIENYDKDHMLPKLSVFTSRQFKLLSQLSDSIICRDNSLCSAIVAELLGNSRKND